MLSPNGLVLQPDDFSGGGSSNNTIVVSPNPSPCTFVTQTRSLDSMVVIQLRLN